MRRSSSHINMKPIHPMSRDLATLLVEVTDEYAPKFERYGIEAEVDVPHDLAVVLDAIIMRDAFRKLIDNALEAMPDGGSLVITALATPDGIVMEFADSGPGVSEELKHRLFEPFSTTKHDHAGLGLSMVRDMVYAHHGTVTVDDCPEGGAAFTIRLPYLREQRMAA